MKQLLFSLLLLPTLGFAEIKQETMQQIGLKIWQNECRGTLDGLISWNAHEEFPSLGIGHFIWYPAGSKKTFDETFPAFIQFLKEKEVEIPSWINIKKGCPWKTREAFLKEIRSKKIRQLRGLLSETLDMQFLFLVKRFELAEAALAPQLTKEEKELVATLKKMPQGLYILIDYVNFKGTGLSELERYRGHGWGLLQVLQTMPKSVDEKMLINQFVTCAKKVLAKRVRNSPKARGEERYLKGWYKRLETYAAK